MSSFALLRHLSPRRIVLATLVGAISAVAVFATFDTPQPRAATAPLAPTGLTGIALANKAGLAWQPSAGATSYSVYRGSTAASITTLVASSVTGTTYVDTGVVNGTKYFYAVKAVSSAGTSPNSAPAQVTIIPRTCSSGNAIVLENCFQGTTGWKAPAGTRTFDNGIEGFTTASSINAGGSVDLKVQVAYDTPYHVEIYRSGWYGGTQGRLISAIPGLIGELPPPCFGDPTGTGVSDCSGWNPVATITTRSDWQSGVYLIKLVRDDNGSYSEFPLIVRSDGSTSDVLYHVPTLTYQAYNVFNGKSLYSGRSDPPKTLTNTNRAVKVSFDRPYAQATSGPDAHDWYARADVGFVSFLEREGYDSTYVAGEDVATNGIQLKNHKVFVTGTHDEYWTQSMFDAVTAARTAGTSIFVQGANTAYWRVRMEASSQSGRANRVEVDYKSIEGGAADPLGPTTTWRDPTGPNKPENQLLGQMYVGENLSQDFPLQVTAEQGRNRIWRYTPLASLATGSTTTVGTSLVGWEWDSRVNNGLEPAGVATAAATPVTGDILQGNGNGTVPGSATQNSTVYKAASGATVFSTGTMNWQRGLATNVDGTGEPTTKIQQATINVLSDMNARPTALSAGLTIDPLGAPSVSSTAPVANGSAVQPNSTLKVVYDRELDPGTVADTDFTLTASDGTVIGLSASLDNSTKTVTLTPADALEPSTSYTASALTSVASWKGVAPAAATTWTFTTGVGTAPVVVSRTPASGATGEPTDTDVTARFDRRLDTSTVTGANARLAPTLGGADVAAVVSYDDATRTVRIHPTGRLNESTDYSVTLTNGIRAVDGVALAGNVTWSLTTGVELQVSGRFPAPLAVGISPAAAVRVVFARAVDASTVTASTVTLRDADGHVVAGTVAFDPSSRTATLTPASPLAVAATYTVAVSGAVRAADGAPATATSWTFTTASSIPAAPGVSGLLPAPGAPSVPNSAVVRATFSVAMDAATVNSQTIQLAPSAGGSPVAATVAYDAASQTATLTPSGALAIGATYAATISTSVRSAGGQPLATNVSWSFTTADCPCSLMDTVTPVQSSLPVQDFRPGSGPFSYELGTKIRVTDPTQLIALKYYKSAGETGTHVGRVWNAAGTQIASVTFAGESHSGWQRQALGTPIALAAGTTYTVSININAFYAKTVDGLEAQLTSGPLHTVAGGTNGAYNDVAGGFPSQSWRNSNYFVDAVVKFSGRPAHTPGVSTVTPASAATGVSASSPVTATFTMAMDEGTINGSTFTLKDDLGASVPGTVSYDAATKTARLVPTGGLDTGHAYTARLSTGVKSDDETALPSAFSWTFSTVAPAAPAVSVVSPADGTTDLPSSATASVTFSTAMDSSTVNGSTVLLTAPGGASVPASVTYDAATRTATLTPTGPLSGATTYTVQVTTGVKSTRNVAMEAPYSWSFSTSNCPCRLFDDTSVAPQYSGLDVSNGRGAGLYSLELGVKIRVIEPANLTAIRFLKDPGETGTHVGRVWNAAGTVVASVTFSAESASGWQQEALATPLALVPGHTYVVSYGANSRFGMTSGALASQITSGPLISVADGQNGVFADAAAVFPTQSWGSSSYFVDAVVS